MATTSSERGLTLRSPGRFSVAADRLVEVARSRRVSGRDDVIRAWIDAEAYRLYTLGTVTDVVVGGAIGAASSLNKLWWSELDVRLHEAALDLSELGWDADGAWMRGYEFALAGPIYAGTNEIQRNIAAERLLQLPRRV